MPVGGGARAGLAMKRAFLRSGHLPTLISCFLYFDLSFAVWVLLGPMAVLIASDLHLDAGQKGLMVAVPVLAGALLRIVNGVLDDRPNNAEAWRVKGFIHLAQRDNAKAKAALMRYLELKPDGATADAVRAKLREL